MAPKDPSRGDKCVHKRSRDVSGHSVPAPPPSFDVAALADFAMPSCLWRRSAKQVARQNKNIMREILAAAIGCD